MGKIKELYTKIQEKEKNVLLVEEAIIEHYADPIDVDHAFYVWAKKQPFTIDDNNYEDFFNLYTEGKIKSLEWIECLGNYYHHIDVINAFNLYAIDKKEKPEDPYADLDM